MREKRSEWNTDPSDEALRIVLEIFREHERGSSDVSDLIESA
jgi:hypothetical protein